MGAGARDACPISATHLFHQLRKNENPPKPWFPYLFINILGLAISNDLFSLNILLIQGFLE